jgi:purine-nucleoside phosphorylase
MSAVNRAKTLNSLVKHEHDPSGTHMTRCLITAVAVLAASWPAAGAQATKYSVLEEYAQPHGSERVNTPEDEIEWLRKNQFTHGELDGFPDRAIVLHRTVVESYLKALGFAGFYRKISYGFTDPVEIYVVRKPGIPAFAVARGLPGAGGITTILAELHAMGVHTAIHVGTCGLMSAQVPFGELIISTGSYKDGGAFLLDDSTQTQISRPDKSLTDGIEAAMTGKHIKYARELGFTMPIYYYQPASMLRHLLAIRREDAPQFIEMEGAALFATATLLEMRAASIVVGSDRLVIHDGNLSQLLWDGDLDALELQAFRVAVRAIEQERP